MFEFFLAKEALVCFTLFLIGPDNEIRPSGRKIAIAIIRAPEAVVRSIWPSLEVVDNIPAGEIAAPIIAPPMCPTPPRKSKETLLIPEIASQVEI